jgi:hypothetical protein
MSASDLFTFRNPYFSAGVGVAVGLFVLTALGGFIVLPYAQASGTRSAARPGCRSALPPSTGRITRRLI